MKTNPQLKMADGKGAAEAHRRGEKPLSRMIDGRMIKYDAWETSGTHLFFWKGDVVHVAASIERDDFADYTASAICGKAFGTFLGVAQTTGFFLRRTEGHRFCRRCVKAMREEHAALNSQPSTNTLPE